jgi:hypothetical protein
MDENKLNDMTSVWWILLLCVAAMLTSCGRHGGGAEKVQPEQLQSYIDISAKYRAWIPRQTFLYQERCDSLTWTALALAAAPELGIDVGRAEVAPGRWLRRPVELPECYATGASRSTISPDGLLSLMWLWAVRSSPGDAQDAIELRTYIDERDGFAGDGRLEGADTYVKPRHRAALNALISQGSKKKDPRRALGGIIDRVISQVPDFCPGGYSCYQKLSLLALIGYLGGELTSADRWEAANALSQAPNNPMWYVLASYISGASLDVPKLRGMLDTWATYPVDRLPTTAETCDEMSFQRERNTVCSEHGEDRGLDLIILLWYIDTLYGGL